MSRWIDAEYCEDFFDRWESRVKNAEPVTIDVVQNTRALLREAPSIDIVRCKECEWCFYVQSDDIHVCGKKGIEHKMHDPTKHFCSYGEREGE